MRATLIVNLTSIDVKTEMINCKELIFEASLLNLIVYCSSEGTVIKLGCNEEQFVSGESCFIKLSPWFACPSVNTISRERSSGQC